MIWAGVLALMLYYLLPGSERARAFNRFIKWIALVVGLLQLATLMLFFVVSEPGEIDREVGTPNVAYVALFCVLNLGAFALIWHDEKTARGDAS